MLADIIVNKPNFQVFCKSLVSIELSNLFRYKSVNCKTYKIDLMTFSEYISV